MSHILVLCSGDNTGLNFTRSLNLAGGYQVTGVDFYLDDYHASEAKNRHLFSDTDDVIARINALAVESQPDLLYVADTGSVLDEVALRRSELIVPTFLPAQSELEAAEDKWRTFELLSAAKLPVPESALAASESDIIEMLLRHPAIWLRRRSGSGGRGALGTSDSSLATAWIQTQNGWGDFTVAERLTNRTATFSGLWLDGKLIASQLRERLDWKYSARSPSGVTGITGSQRTIWDPDLHKIGMLAVLAVAPGATGAFGVDFTFDLEGRPRITEVQPARFYSSIFFLAAAGINFADLYCRLAIEHTTAMEPLINPIRDSRYWLKAVDKNPQLLTEAEYLDARSL